MRLSTEQLMAALVLAAEEDMDTALIYLIELGAVGPDDHINSPAYQAGLAFANKWMAGEA